MNTCTVHSLIKAVSESGKLSAVGLIRLISDPRPERVFISAAPVSETDAVHDMLHTALIAQTSSCFQQ